MCIFVFGPYSSPSKTFPMLLIQSAFLLCTLGCNILPRNCFVSLSSGGWYIFMHCPCTCSRIFSFLESPALFVLFQSSRYVFSLPSFASTFCLFHKIVCFVLTVVFLFFFLPNMFQRFSSVLSFSLVVGDIFICIFSRISHPGFEFLFVFIR